MSIPQTINSSKAAPTTKASGAVAPAAKVPQRVVANQVANEEVPSFSSLRDYLRGKDCTLYAGPTHPFTRVYCDVKRIGEDPGRFPCKILDVIVDERTGQPISAIVQYRERGARVLGSRDCISLEGISISTAYTLPPREEAEEVALAE